MIDLFNYKRRASGVTHVGKLNIGGDNPVRVQSMTTTSTDDTEGSVAQCQRIIDAGGELVRLTTQGRREAENMSNIREQLRKNGYAQPLCADVHFNANVADVAAVNAEKVRINPGNYVDPARTFKHLEYTEEEYAEELRKIEERLTTFINICKEHHTAVRIGVNHGSLSDRIMSRYGDTPEGIVESCMEFLRVFKKQDFSDVVISVKASNTVVMVQSVRLLVAAMDKEGMNYPLHLGVTEAGEGEDGRIKSAVGIGALLADGIGDTIRVSLSEEPEAEIPVAKHLTRYVRRKQGHLLIPATEAKQFDYLHPTRRHTQAVDNVGGNHAPIVITSQLSQPAEGTKAGQERLKPDYIYVGQQMPEHPEEGQRYIVDFNTFASELRKHMDAADRMFPIFPHNAMPYIASVPDTAPIFLVLPYGTSSEEYTACLRANPNVVVVVPSQHPNRLGEQRALAHDLMAHGLTNPIVFAQAYKHGQEQRADFQLEAAADMGALMVDGLTDGIWLMNDGDIAQQDITDTAFAILQAGRLRMVKTEYISCPGCGRTLYDLRTTIARIKEATSGMKGLKIGVMGCIVNGPGEMADADYGYVGAGPGRIALYRGKECVERGIPEEEAVERLLNLIKSDQQQ